MTALRPLSRNWVLYGSATEPVAPWLLRAGPLQLRFEPGSGFVRGICLGEREVLRGIYAAVRDRNWGTVPSQVSLLESRVSNDDFALKFDVECRQGDIDFVWHGFLQGKPDGSVRYEFDGEARSTFLRNRIGFCVLHPIRECAGAAARQTCVDGRLIECRFPDAIEPQILGKGTFRDLRKVAHEVAPGLWAEVEFDGDVFEMEDQRNWTDASFKTYCTPLALPFPVQVQAGARIGQSVTLRLIGSAGSKSEARLTTHRREPELIEITVPDAQATPCPHLGLGMASDGSELTATEVARLRRLKLAHLRVDVRLAAPDWARVWDRAVRQARQLGVALELALHLPADGEGDMPAWKRCLQACATPLARVLALREGESATTRETLRRVRRAMSGFDAPVGAGSDANFCELNREQALGRLALAEADFIFWPINPQVHAFDNASIMETLEAQPDSVRTARRFAPGKPLVISPITLKPRFNAVATGVPPASSQDELPPNVDARQLSLFTATWTLASFAALAGSGVASLTLYETTGWRGVMERETGSRFPERFPSAPGRVFPVYHTFAGLAGCESDTSAVVRKQSPVAALGLFGTEDDQRVLMGNLTPLPQHVHLRTSEPSAVVRVLDERQALVMSRSDRFHTDSNRRLSSHHGVMKLQLPPFALVWLEFRSLNPIPQEHK